MEKNMISTIKAFLLLYLSNQMARSYLIELVENQKFDSAFSLLNKGDQLAAYKYVFEYLSDDVKYQLFIDIYNYVESGFRNVTVKMLDKLKRLRPIDSIDILKEKEDTDGYITIYRGSSSRSRPVEKAISWTLNHDIAEFFAKRFDETESGVVYEAKAKNKDVIAYINGRKEEEVLIRYKKVQLISVRKRILEKNLNKEI